MVFWLRTKGGTRISLDVNPFRFLRKSGIKALELMERRVERRSYIDGSGDDEARGKLDALVRQNSN